MQLNYQSQMFMSSGKKSSWRLGTSRVFQGLILGQILLKSLAAGMLGQWVLRKSAENTKLGGVVGNATCLCCYSEGHGQAEEMSTWEPCQVQQWEKQSPTPKMNNPMAGKQL